LKSKLRPNSVSAPVDWYAIGANGAVNHAENCKTLLESPPILAIFVIYLRLEMVEIGE